MKHARSDYDGIQAGAGRRLAEMALALGIGGEDGERLAALAREVLAAGANGPDIPEDEPVFLIRGQDAAGGDAVRAWADLASARGAGDEIVGVARAHARLMDAWPKKKAADLPAK